MFYVDISEYAEWKIVRHVFFSSETYCRRRGLGTEATLGMMKYGMCQKNNDQCSSCKVIGLTIIFPYTSK